MLLLQYFGWVGGFLFAALLAANWCFSVPIALAPRSDVPFDQRINIRIHTDQKWPERVVLDTTRSTLAQGGDAQPDVGGHETPVLGERKPSTHSRRWRPCPSRLVFDRPAPPVWLQRGRSHQSRTARRFKIAHARQLWRTSVSLSPIGFTSRKEEV